LDVGNQAGERWRIFSLHQFHGRCLPR
jgi:hypothetical protein